MYFIIQFNGSKQGFKCKVFVVLFRKYSYEILIYANIFKYL